MPDAPAPPPPAPEPAPEPAREPSTPEPAEPAEEPAPEPQSDTAPPKAAPETPDAETVTWTASEFIAHAKSFSWYAALALIAVVGATLIYVLTKDPVSAGVIIIAAIFFGIYAGHKPRELEYQVDTRGLSIGQKHFSYHQFKSFSVLPEGAFSSIVFMPLKRFAPPTTIYYPPEDENRIVSLLGNYLPHEERGHDAIDRLMHRIHF